MTIEGRALRHIRPVALLVAGAFFMENLDGTVITTALPAMAASFGVTIWGGSLCRAAIGSAPFLLPLMFQVGFGLDALRSGLLVIAVFAGNLLMKPATTPILRHFGFKPVLVGNGLLAVLSLLACAFLTPKTPVPVIAAILFCGGLTRSMQFTVLSTIAFADIPDAKMSSANTLFSTAFQLTMGLGVALGAIAIRAGHGLAAASGLGAVPAIDYRLAFVLVAFVALLGLADGIRLDRLAGDHVARRPVASGARSG